MRKLLLGTTAVAGFALAGADVALAQDAPPRMMVPAMSAIGVAPASPEGLSVRLGGYFRFGYAFTDQDFGNNTVAPSGAVAAQTIPVVGGGGGTVTIPATAASGGSVANTGKNDFQTDAEIHVIIGGKAANGMSYGAFIELQVDSQSDTSRGSKTLVDTDEMWAFVATPTLGQLRFGDEDGVLGGLMNAGHITNFGSGGVDGDAGDFLIGQARYGTIFPGDIGDNTKIIYLSPQFFGFDFGTSFAFNTGEGEDTGCGTSGSSPASATCDRAGGFTGTLATVPRRRNEVQVALRWRGTFEGVGIAISGGYLGADVTKVLNTTGGASGLSGKRYNVWTIGGQVTAFGFTVGGHYWSGSANPGGVPLLRGTGVVDNRDAEQYFFGASYTTGPLTVGANYYHLTSAGSQIVSAARKESGFGLGATYVLAPGFNLVGDVVWYNREEQGFNFATNSANTAAANGVRPAINSSADSNVFRLGLQIAW
jgi:hypothetical protein